MLPETHYARSGEVRIAYQVVGTGPFDLVFVPGFISNLDLAWEEPSRARFFSRLASFSRLILFDKRGTGLSDRVGSIPTLEERMDDVRAVMDAVGSQRAALFGISEGGAMSMLFAATHPDRTQALVLYGAYGHFPTWVLPPDRLAEFIEVIERAWGTGETLRFFAPSVASDERFRQGWARFERLGASPSAVIALMRMNNEIDVRHVAHLIRVPTLVVHRTGDTRVNVGAGRFLAASIPNAKYVELPGSDHLLWVGNIDRVADEVEEFLTGSRAQIEPDRVLATILFTDIVDSTRQASELGDRDWRAMLNRHNEIVRREIDHLRGHEIKTLGDGFLATFDGPGRAVRCAMGIVDTTEASLNLKIRAGVHTGEIEVQPDGDISGIAVHIAARVAALAEGGQVLVSSTVRDLAAGTNIAFVAQGARAIKGVDEEIRLFSVSGR